ncbi:MAG: hypothetical protein ACOYU2_00710 [Nitrospirota bacterium]
MAEKQEDISVIGEKSRMSVERLQKIIDETQETIRAYDIKAEILAVILTLVIGIVNFTLVTDVKSIEFIKYTALITTAVGVIALLINGIVLYPKKDVFKAIQTNKYKPKRTYFVNIEDTPTFNNIDIYVDEVDSTDWKHELAYEVLKISLIRDRKHVCFVWALRLSGLAFLGLIILLAGIIVYG